MEAKHTPGPWSAQDSGMIRARGCSVAEVIPQGTADANARLIAAAPDLLAALENVRNVLAALAIGEIKDVKTVSAALAQARAAIAKATGTDT